MDGGPDGAAGGMYTESTRVGSNLNIEVANRLASREFSDNSQNSEKIPIILRGFKNEIFSMVEFK